MKYTDTSTEFDVVISDQGCCTRVVVAGLPSIGQLVSLIHLMGVESSSWKHDTLLVDLRRVATAFSSEEQFQIGQEAACSLAHLRKIASVVPPERITHISERAAKRNGTNVCVFGEEAAALAWLRAD